MLQDAFTDSVPPIPMPAQLFMDRGGHSILLLAQNQSGGRGLRELLAFWNLSILSQSGLAQNLAYVLWHEGSPWTTLIYRTLTYVCGTEGGTWYLYMFVIWMVGLLRH